MKIKSKDFCVQEGEKGQAQKVADACEAGLEVVGLYGWRRRERAARSER